MVKGKAAKTLEIFRCSSTHRLVGAHVCKMRKLHCKNKSVCSTPKCLQAHTTFGVWCTPGDILVCCTHFRFYSVEGA